MLMRYGCALRCVTGIYYSTLRSCVTVCHVGVLCQCVMVRYGGMLRCVTVRYFDVHYGVLQHYVTTVDNNHCYQGLQTLPYYFRFYSKARSTTYYAYISYVHWYAYCYQLCMTHVNHPTQLFHILLLLTQQLTVVAHVNNPACQCLRYIVVATLLLMLHL